MSISTQKISSRIDDFNSDQLHKIFNILHNLNGNKYDTKNLSMIINSPEYIEASRIFLSFNLKYLLSKCIIYDLLCMYSKDSDLIIKETNRKMNGNPSNGIDEKDWVKFLLKQRLYIAKKIKQEDIKRVIYFRNLADKDDFIIGTVPVPTPPKASPPASPLDGFEGLSENQVNNIFKLTSVFENSTTDLQFGYCENIKDGRGYTFGFVGFCSGTYDGTMVIEEYCNLKPGNILAKYLPAFQRIDAGPHRNGCNPDVSGLEGLVSDVKSAGSDQTFVNSQINVAKKLYITPSQQKIKELGLSLPISKGQFYDMYINHGEDGALSIIRSVSLPKNDEKKWLNELLSKRMDILASDKTWADSVDRVRVYQKLLKSGNVDLKSPINFVCYGDSFVI